MQIDFTGMAIEAAIAIMKVNLWQALFLFFLAIIARKKKQRDQLVAGTSWMLTFMLGAVVIGGVALAIDLISAGSL